MIGKGVRLRLSLGKFLAPFFFFAGLLITHLNFKFIMSKTIKIHVAADCFAPDGSFLSRGKTADLDADSARALCNSGRASYLPAASPKKPRGSKGKKPKANEANAPEAPEA